MLRRLALVVLLLCAAAARPSRAEAEEAPTATLRYQPPATPADCPSESELRDAVSARLGYVPFVEGAALEVSVRIERGARRELRAIVEARRDGASPSERTLTARSCNELGRAVALALSLAIDPLGRGREAAEASSAPVTDAPSPDEPAGAGTAALTTGVIDGRPGTIVIESPGGRDGRDGRDGGEPAADAAATTRITLGVGAGATANTLPGPSLALQLGVGARRGAWSASIEAQAELPASAARAASAGGGEVSAYAIVASAVPCRHRGRWLGCTVVSAGRLRGEGAGVAMPRTASSWVLRAGLRGGVEVAMRHALALRLTIDVLAPIAPIALDLDGAQVWRTPSIELAGGVSVRVNLR